MRKFDVISVGCKVNQCDSSLIAEELASHGMKRASRGERIDLAVVNTCCVTATGEHKSRKAIRRVARENPEAGIVATGCYAAIAPHQLSSLPNVVRVMPRWDAENLPIHDNSAVGDKPFVFPPPSDRTRAFLKIQDGCDNHCSFCIVPLARGKPGSVPLEKVLERARSLAGRGAKEIVVCGVRLGRFEHDGAAALPMVLSALERIPGIERVRLSSIEPNEVPDELIDFAARSERLCAHFHMPLQSGEDEILRRMNRKYTAGEYLEVVEKIRAKIDEPALTTDVMIGFPGETETHFESTMRMCERVGFSKIHIFVFSPRPGTPAATLSDRPPCQEVLERKLRLERLELELAHRFRRALVGRQARVLVESCRPGGLLSGHTERYVQVRFPGPPSLINHAVKVTIESAFPRHVEGKLAAT